jgi:hypothetical protein
MNDSQDILQRACAIADIDATGARLLRVGSNAVYRPASETSHASLSISEVIRPLPEHGSPQGAPDTLACLRLCGQPSKVRRRTAGDLTAA